MDKKTTKTEKKPVAEAKETVKKAAAVKTAEAKATAARVLQPIVK